MKKPLIIITILSFILLILSGIIIGTTTGSEATPFLITFIFWIACTWTVCFIKIAVNTQKSKDALAEIKNSFKKPS